LLPAPFRNTITTMRNPSIIILALSILLVACRKEESDTLPEDTSIYQDYKVIFDKTDNRTRAYATFRRSNSWGTRLQLTGGASITFNGNAHSTYTELDNYFYRWNTTGMVDVNFRFTRSDGAWFENSILRNDTNDVAVPANLVLSRTNGGLATWIGQPLVQGERMEVWVRQNGSNTSKTTLDVAGTSAIFIPGTVLSSLTIGTADLYFNRSRTVALNEGDNNAGGRRIIEVEARGTVTIE
jgi:hypothetical protein